MTEYYIVNSWRELWNGRSWTKVKSCAESYSYEEGMEIINRRFCTKIRRPGAKRYGGYRIIDRPTLVEREEDGY